LLIFINKNFIFSDFNKMPGQKGQNWTKPKNQPSKEEVKCVACQRIFRRDKINSRHYVKVVKLDGDNKPARPGSVHFNSIEDESMRIHTEYFYKNKLDPFSTKACNPVSAKDEPKLSPFEEMERRKLLKRSIGSSEAESTNVEGLPSAKIQRRLQLVGLLKYYGLF
jgi:hypothetical protein